MDGWCAVRALDERNAVYDYFMTKGLRLYFGEAYAKGVPALVEEVGTLSRHLEDEARAQEIEFTSMSDREIEKTLKFWRVSRTDSTRRCVSRLSVASGRSASAAGVRGVSHGSWGITNVPIRSMAGSIVPRAGRRPTPGRRIASRRWRRTDTGCPTGSDDPPAASRGPGARAWPAGTLRCRRPGRAPALLIS